MNFTVSNQYAFFPRFFRLAIANSLSIAIIPLAGLITVAFLGHLADIRYLAGAALATILFDFLYDFLNFFRWGTTAMTAIAVGENDREQLLLVGLRNGIIALGVGILILILHFPLEQLGFAVLRATEDVKAAGINYFDFRIWGAPAVLVNYVLIGWFMGREQSSKVLLLTAIGNGANIVQDYVYIVQWNWGTAGAGLSQAISQYLMCFIGIIFVSLDIEWKELKVVVPKLWNKSAFQSIFSLNQSLLIRNISSVACFAMFSNLGAAMGTEILAENGLLFQIMLVTIYILTGVAYTTSTLSGNFRGQKANDRIWPLLQLAIATNTIVAVTVTGVSILFPEIVFGVLTNHVEILTAVKNYVPWLLLVLAGVGVSQNIEAYFLGLGKASIIRNAFLIAALFGFAPLAGLAWYFQSNHILWLAMSMFMVGRVMILSFQLPKTFSSNVEVDTNRALS